MPVSIATTGKHNPWDQRFEMYAASRKRGWTEERRDNRGPGYNLALLENIKDTHFWINFFRSNPQDPKFGFPELRDEDLYTKMQISHTIWVMEGRLKVGFGDRAIIEICLKRNMF